MTRLDRSAESTLVQQLTTLRTDVDALKVAQLVGGANLVGYLMQSSAANDLSVTIGAGAKASYRITFTGAASTYSPLIGLYLFYAQDPNVLANAIPPYASGQSVSLADQALPPQAGLSQWFITFTNNTGSSQAAYLKLIFDSTVDGTWAITAA